MKKYVAAYVFLLFFCGCKTPTPLSFFSGNRMTIDYHITVGESLNESQRNEVQQVIDNVFHEIDRTFNKWNPESEVSRINRLPAHTAHHLSPQLQSFFYKLDKLVVLSEGLFDPTIEPLQKLWIGKLEHGTTPTHEEIAEIKTCIGWKNISISGSNLSKNDERTQLDFGGVAKGLCVDMLMESLQEAGYCNLYIEWGGEIRACGKHPSNRPWRIFISQSGDPNPSKALAFIDLQDQALATSGDYFQFWNVVTAKGDATTFCHVFNPIILSPLEVKNGSVTSASLLAKDCVTADALAKVLMLFESVEKAEVWMQMLREKDPNLECWIVTR